MRKDKKFKDAPSKNISNLMNATTVSGIVIESKASKKRYAQQGIDPDGSEENKADKTADKSLTVTNIGDFENSKPDQTYDSILNEVENFLIEIDG